MDIPAQVKKHADSLLHHQKGTKEVDVVHNLRSILEEYDIEVYSEYPAGAGSIDIYAPRHRLLFEAKAPHTPSLVKHHKPQLDRYAERIARDERQRLHFDRPPRFCGYLNRRAGVACVAISL